MQPHCIFFEGILHPKQPFTNPKLASPCFDFPSDSTTRKIPLDDARCSRNRHMPTLILPISMWRFHTTGAGQSGQANLHQGFCLRLLRRRIHTSGSIYELMIFAGCRPRRVHRPDSRLRQNGQIPRMWTRRRELISIRFIAYSFG